MFKTFYSLVDFVDDSVRKMEKILIKYLNPNYLSTSEIDYELSIRDFDTNLLENKEKKLDEFRQILKNELEQEVLVERMINAPENRKEVTTCMEIYREIAEYLEGANSSPIPALSRLVHLYFRIYRIEFDKSISGSKVEFLDDIMGQIRKHFPEVYEEVQEAFEEESELNVEKRKITKDDSLEFLLEEIENLAIDKPKNASKSKFNQYCGEFLNKIRKDCNLESDYDSKRLNVVSKVIKTLTKPENFKEVNVINNNFRRTRLNFEENHQSSSQNNNGQSIVINLDHSQNETRPQSVRLDINDSRTFSSKLKPWKLSFSGREDPQSIEQFLKTLHYVKSILGGSDFDLFSCLGEILKGEAYNLIMANIDQYENWEQIEEDLRSLFTKPKNDMTVKQEIYIRQQKRDESFADFLIEMKKLFAKLKRPMSNQEQFEVVYANMKKVYQINLSFVHDVVDLKSLSMACAELDKVLLSNIENEKSSNNFSSNNNRNNYNRYKNNNSNQNSADKQGNINLNEIKTVENQKIGNNTNLNNQLNSNNNSNSNYQHPNMSYYPYFGNFPTMNPNLGYSHPYSNYPLNYNPNAQNFNTNNNFIPNNQNYNNQNYNNYSKNNSNYNKTTEQSQFQNSNNEKNSRNYYNSNYGKTNSNNYDSNKNETKKENSINKKDTSDQSPNSKN